MNTANADLTAVDCTLRPRICWSAILYGALIGVGLGFLLHLFSIAIGLSAYSATVDGVLGLYLYYFLLEHLLVVLAPVVV